MEKNSEFDVGDNNDEDDSTDDEGDRDEYD